MIKPYSKIIRDTRAVSNGRGDADLSRLCVALGYWAPEMIEYWFWYGHGGVWGYLDILNNYFKENKDVRSVYTNFMHKYYKRTTIEV